MRRFTRANKKHLHKKIGDSGSTGIIFLMLGIAIILDGLSAFVSLFEIMSSGGIPWASGIINFIGMITVGIWLWFRNKKKKGIGSKLFKRLSVSGIIEAAPVVSTFSPTWSINVISEFKEKKQIYIILISTMIIGPVILMVLIPMLMQEEEACAIPGATQCGFDRSKLSTYESTSNGPADPDPCKVMDPVGAPGADGFGKAYAINELGIPEEDVRSWLNDQEKVWDIVREEIYAQWPEHAEYAEEHGSDQALVQRAILTYVLREGGWYKLRTPKENDDDGGDSKYIKRCGNTDGLIPVAAWWEAGHQYANYPTYHPPSITAGKYIDSKNKQYGIAWDIRYSIYIGVGEIFNYYKSAEGKGEEKWKNALSKCFGSSSFWNSTADKAWNEYFSNEAPETERIKQKCEASGQMSEVPLLQQASPPWGPMVYGNQSNCTTYAEAGCGATSLTMVLNYFTGQNRGVHEIGQEIADNGWRPCNNGTAWAAMTGMPQKYGLSSQELGLNWQGVENCFKEGGVVIASMGNCEFTSRGHFIVLTGTSGNTVFINDPGRRGKWESTVSQVSSPTCAKNYWCIKK